MVSTQRLYQCLRQLFLEVNWFSISIMQYSLLGLFLSTRKFLLLALNLSSITILFQYIKTGVISHQTVLICSVCCIFYVISVFCISKCKSRIDVIRRDYSNPLRNLIRTLSNVITALLEGGIFVVVLTVCSAPLALLSTIFFVLLVVGKIQYNRSRYWTIKVLVNPSFASNLSTLFLVVLLVPLQLNFQIKLEYQLYLSVFLFYLTRRALLASFSVAYHLIRLGTLIHKNPQHLDEIQHVNSLSRPFWQKEKR